MAAALHELLALATARLSPLSDTAQLDAQLLLAHVLQKSRTWVLAHPENRPRSAHVEGLEALLGRLESGEPLPYLLGHQEFFGLDFEITSDVLIPRPETELLVQSALEWLKGSAERRTVADIGTGSGCIAVSLAVHLSDARVLATDISREALKVASRNARKLHVDRRIDFVECDILPAQMQGAASDRRFDLVCANLPYIPSKELRALAVFGREPTLALDGGPDGLEPFRRFFEIVPGWMAPGGRILLEIESSRGTAVLSLAYDAFHSASIHLHRDLAGHDRLLEVQLPSA